MHHLMQDLIRAQRRFAKDEDGMITVFASFMILMMLMMGGLGVDLMRQEMERTRIQSVADRAVLAAADLDQTLDPETIVRDYFEKSGMGSFVSEVNVDEGLNYRTVTVDAKTVMNTSFIDILGVETLSVPAFSSAEEKVSKVEISMVLDISGSMGWNNKMDNLQDAAGVFIDTVLNPANQDLISISVIPYTAQVNAGEMIFDELNVPQVHSWSYCVDFDDSDFNNAGLSLTKEYEQMQHFDAGYYWNGGNNISNPGCPKRSYETILGFSQNATTLKNRINKFRARANTAIHLGMKWGVALLDPSFRPVTQKLGVDAPFTNRPAAYNDVETLKTVILMTDGENVSTRRISADRYNSRDERRTWKKYPLGWYLNRYVRYYDQWRWRYTKYTPSQADGLLSNICDAAKENRIVIWSIGFEVSDHGANVMRDCASSPSHFFRVEGVEISDAFQAIARQINQLRLVQ